MQGHFCGLWRNINFSEKYSPLKWWPAPWSCSNSAGLWRLPRWPKQHQERTEFAPTLPADDCDDDDDHTDDNDDRDDDYDYHTNDDIDKDNNDDRDDGGDDEDKYVEDDGEDSLLTKVKTNMAIRSWPHWQQECSLLGKPPDKYDDDEEEEDEDDDGAEDDSLMKMMTIRMTGMLIMIMSIRAQWHI